MDKQLIAMLELSLKEAKERGITEKLQSLLSSVSNYVHASMELSNLIQDLGDLEEETE